MIKTLGVLLLTSCAWAANLKVVPTTTFAAETAKPALWTASGSNFNGTIRQCIGGTLYSTSLFFPSPGPISDVSFHSLLYPGHTSKVWVHTTEWFSTKATANCGSTGADLNYDNTSGGHTELGFTSDTASVISNKVDLMQQMGVDGIIALWHGPSSQPLHNTAVRYRDELLARGMDFSVQIGSNPITACAGGLPSNAGSCLCAAGDSSSCGCNALTSRSPSTGDPASDKSACWVANEVVYLLRYINSNFINIGGVSNPSYTRRKAKPSDTASRPLVTFFDVDNPPDASGAAVPTGATSTSSPFWAFVRANALGDPLFVFRQKAGLTHQNTNGAFGWQGNSQLSTGTLGAPADPNNCATVTTTAHGHVVVVALENHSYEAKWGGAVNDTSSAGMPYFNNTLIPNYGLATNFFANGHDSLKQYFVLNNGSQFCIPHGNDPTVACGGNPATYSATAENIFHAARVGGLSWKQYAECMPNSTFGIARGNIKQGNPVDGCGFAGNYMPRHIPAIYYSDVRQGITPLADVDCSSVSGTLGYVSTLAKQGCNVVKFEDPNWGFAADIAAKRLPAYSFITPAGKNDAHNGSRTAADTWMQQNLAGFLSSCYFTGVGCTADGMLIVWWDEGAVALGAYTGPCASSGYDNRLTAAGCGGGGRVAIVIAAPDSVVGAQVGTYYTHEALTKLILTGLGLSTSAFPAAVQNAPSMQALFTGTGAGGASDPYALTYLNDLFNATNGMSSTQTSSRSQFPTTAFRDEPNVLPGVIGFQNRLTPWGQSGQKMVCRNYGAGLLNSFNTINQYFDADPATAKPQAGDIQLITWNDYDEGSAIEPGQQNNVSISASLSGSTLSWSATGAQEVNWFDGSKKATVARYDIYIGPDTTNLMRLDAVNYAAASGTVDLRQYSLEAGSYFLYVKAVGNAGMLNHISSSVGPYVQTVQAGTNSSRPKILTF